jgi:flagellar biosynthesis component FlhA
MTPLTIAIAAAIFGLLLGTALVPGAPIFGLPIVAILIVILAMVELKRRRGEAQNIQELRDEAKAEPVEFTARDRETLA